MEGFGILELKVSELSKLLLDTFISPLLEGKFSVSSANETLTLHRESGASKINPLFVSLSLFITYISSHLHHRALRLLKPQLLPSLAEKIQVKILSTATSIPLTELPSFDVLIEEVKRFERHLVESDWARSTPLKTWAANAPQTWFEGRQAVFLDDSRILIGESLDSLDIVITSGINITTDLSDQEQLPQTDEAISAPSQKNGLLEQKIGGSESIEEDESDGWKFDEEEETPEVDDSFDASEWKWGDDEVGNEEDDVGNEEEDVGNEEDDEVGSEENPSDAFPYAISATPDRLINLIKRLLDEGLEL